MAAPVVVKISISARQTAVWAVLADLESHVEWMADAESLVFLTNQHSGVGTRMEVETRFGPFRTSDVMEFTAWDPPERMAVRHQGLFSGFGEFRLEPGPDDTTVIAWRERILFPWFFGGPVGAWLARPVFGWVWRRNLRRLRDRVQRPEN